MPKILLVEDDRDLTLMLKELLESELYNLDIALEGKGGWEYLRQGHYDVVILDWHLPGLSGLEILKRYRESEGVTPILMLTGQGQIADKEEGLDAGADDYLTKPFSSRELLARVRAMLRRKIGPVTNLLRAGDLEMDPSKHILKRQGKELHLQHKDFELLEFLMRHPGEIFSTEALLRNVWSFETEATSDAVRTSVKRIRQQLDESADDDKSIIENVRRVGYRLNVS